MPFRVTTFNKAALVLLLLLLSFAVISCSVHEQKTSENKKKVDIETPFGGIHVNTDASAGDTGLSVYPGATKQDNSTGDEQRNQDNANVNVQVGDFGVRVIATKYLSDDPPDKIISFYRDDMKKYGSVLECPKGLKEEHSSNGPREMVCNDSGTAEKGKMDLAVGTPERQRIVSVKPNGAGTRFEVVYIQLRGGKHDTI
ncbi:MAG TPA: hypothetical protein VKW78_16845 [Terriglobales bacterium]|nr:hypothetical protein [Terriglobales bacterium]